MRQQRTQYNHADDAARSAERGQPVRHGRSGDRALAPSCTSAGLRRSAVQRRRIVHGSRMRPPAAMQQRRAPPLTCSWRRVACTRCCVAHARTHLISGLGGRAVNWNSAYIRTAEQIRKRNNIWAHSIKLIIPEPPLNVGQARGASLAPKQARGAPESRPLRVTPEAAPRWRTLPPSFLLRRPSWRNWTEEAARNRARRAESPPHNRPGV
jgi:hypothetical protein